MFLLAWRCGHSEANLKNVAYLQGIITDMMEDCQAGIGWVLRNIEGFGGDPSRVYVMGQSCGGHLAALTLQKQHELWGSGEIKAANRRGLSDSSWNPDSIKACPRIPLTAVRFYHVRSVLHSI